MCTILVTVHVSAQTCCVPSNAGISAPRGELNTTRPERLQRIWNVTFAMFVYSKLCSNSSQLRDT
jgi:hypothetical protein